jgi:HlyD family secretion protein
MLKKIATTSAFVIAVAASVGALYFHRGDAGVTASTTTVSEGDVVQAVTASGTLEAVRTVDVGSQVSGTIAGLYADFNSIVAKGQRLAEIDPSLLQAQTAQARAGLQSAEAGVERLQVALEDARATLGRAEGLDGKQLITRSDLDAARLAVRVAEAQLRAGGAQLVQARASVEQCLVNEQHARIDSPIDGIVISRSVDVGQTVAASMQAPTLFTIALDLSHLRLKASVSESDIGLIREGQPVRFRVDAYADQAFTGTVSQVRLQPTSTQNVVTYTTIVDVPNPSLRLRPGMTAQTSIEIARRDAATRVPNTALRFRPTSAMFAALGQAAPTSGGPGGRAAGARLWMWVNRQLRPVAVRTGITDGTYTEILDGAPGADVELVTNLSVPVASAKATSTSSPLMQNGPPAGMPPPPPGGMGGGPPPR